MKINHHPKVRRFLIIAILIIATLSLSAFRGASSISAQEEDPYVEIINETDTTLCLFGAVPEGVTEVSQEHIFAEEELEPGDDFWVEVELEGAFTLIATDCDEYTIVAEAAGVILGQVPVVWYVGDSGGNAAPFW